KKLWGDFVRLNLEYCIHSGTQFNCHIEDGHCPLPSGIDLRQLENPFSDESQGLEMEDETHSDSMKANFELAATKLSKVIVPLRQIVTSSNPGFSTELERFRAAAGAILAELPRPLQLGESTSNLMVHLQQSLLLMNMYTYMLVLKLGSALGTA